MSRTTKFEHVDPEKNDHKNSNEGKEDKGSPRVRMTTSRGGNPANATRANLVLGT